MADEDIRNGAVHDRNGAVHDDENTVLDQPAADQHSAFLDDEELSEQLPNEFDADDRTALTAAHEGSDAHGELTDSATGWTSLLTEDSLDPALVQTTGGSLSVAARVDGSPFGDAVFGETPLGNEVNGSPDEVLSAPSLLNSQSSDETNADDQPALVAAHQGARATSVPADSTAAFNSAAQADLFDETLGQASRSPNSASRSSSDALLGDPAGDILGDLDLDQSIADGNSAQNTSGGGQGPATAAEFSAGETAGATTDTSSIDDLQFNGGDGDQASSDGLASNGPADEDPLLDLDVSGEAGSGSTDSDDGLGGSEDQSGSTDTTSNDDNEELLSDDSGGGGGGGNGVNPIIGTQFDDNLVGTDGRDMINAQGGDDTLSGGAGNDNLLAGAGDDLIEGGAGDDTLKGGAGDDVMVWDSADAVIDGGADTDTLQVDAGDADFTTFGGSINNIETIDLQSDTGANTVTLSAQNVLDMTDAGNTLTITGDTGDSLEAGNGWTDGGLDGDGNQIYTQVVGPKTATLIVDPDITANADMLPDVATAGDDTLTGTAADDTFDGLAGNDALVGAGGDDTLTGGYGSDTMSGGTGDDTFLFTDSDFDGSNGWVDTVDGYAEGGDLDVIDLTGVSQGWTLEVDGAGAGVEASAGDNPSKYTGDDMSGTITFDDGSMIDFQNIEKVDW